MHTRWHLIASAVVGLCLVTAIVLWTHPWSFPWDAAAKIIDAKKEALQAARETITTLTTIAMSLIGGLSFFFTKRKELQLLQVTTDRYLFMAALLASVASLVFGFALSSSILDMLANGIFDPLSPGFRNALTYDAACVILSVSLGALLLARHL